MPTFPRARGFVGQLCVTALLAATILILIAYFAQATFDSSPGWLDASNTLTLLTVLLAVSTVLLTSAVHQAFELIQWTAIGDVRGTTLLVILAISPTTSLLGVLRVLMHRQADLKARFGAILRLVLTTSTCQQTRANMISGYGSWLVYGSREYCSSVSGIATDCIARVLMVVQCGPRCRRHIETYSHTP